jgi:hypothetical protein
MASKTVKTVPAKKTSTTAKDKSTDPQEASITTIKKSTCKTLQGTATLTYHIGLDDNGAIQWKIAASTGNGMYSREYVAFTDIQKALADWPGDLPITSMTLRALFQGKSVNTPAFLLATLVKEGLLAPVPDKKRHYQLGDDKPFLSAVDEMKGSHSQPGKATPKVKAKAATRMSKNKAKPATGK